VGRFKSSDRPGLPVLALNADATFLTSWSNDVGYDHVFARQVETFGRPGDVLLGIGTTGRSRNILEAFAAARRQKMRCVALLGGDGGELRELADVALIVPSFDGPHIREVQMVLLNLLCELVEGRLGSTGPVPAAHAALAGPARRRRGRRERNGEAVGPHATR
jgi:phosphoheptose isomerase